MGRSIIDGGDGLLMEAPGSSEMPTRTGTVTSKTAAFVLYLLTAKFDGVGTVHLKGRFVYLWCISTLCQYVCGYSVGWQNNE